MSNASISRRFRIMVVDDDRLITVLYQKLFADTDYILMTAGDGVEALQLLDKFKPDLIISDVMMPRMDGYEFCRKLRLKPEQRTRSYCFRPRFVLKLGMQYRD